MADQKISALTNYTTPQSGDLIPIVDISGSTTKKVTLANLSNILSSIFRIKDSSDTSKKIAFDVSGVTTSTTRTLTIPDADMTVVGTAVAQTLTNKKISTGTTIDTSGSDSIGSMYYRDATGSLVALAPGSDGNIPSISAGVPVMIPNPAASDASTTVKGVVEEATQVEVDAGTATGGTSARLFQNPSTIRARFLNTGVADTGSANAYAIAPIPAITVYAAYQEFTFKAANTNTGASTVNVSTVGTKNIFNAGAALTGGEIVSGRIYTIVYDGTQFQITSTASAGVIKYSKVQTTKAGTPTGDVTIAHGLTVPPRFIKCYATNVATTGSSGLSISSGTSNGASGNSCAYSQATTIAGQDAAKILYLGSATAGHIYAASVTAVDATNITLNFSAVDSVAATTANIDLEFFG